jgi:Bacterial SH3 domain
MSRKASVIIVSTLTGLAAIAGVTAAVNRPNHPTDPFSFNPPPVEKSRVARSSVPVTPLNPPAPTKPVSTNSPAPIEEEAPKPTQPASREVQKCVIQMAKVTDVDSPLNVRSVPSTTTTENIVGTLKNGTYVTVVEEQPEWFRISTPSKGWIARSKTEHTCGVKVEQVGFGAGQESILIDDRFIGAGNHEYRFNLQQGQEITVTSQQGPLPSLLAPDGKPLTDMQGEKATWTGTAPATGDYALVLESNFKGYKYRFTLTAR